MQRRQWKERSGASASSSYTLIEVRTVIPPVILSIIERSLRLRLSG
jgi:hypothetical protein